MAYKKKTKNKALKVEMALVHVKATFNNTLVSATTMSGDVITRASAGQLSFKGARKGTPFAATQIANKVAKDLVDLGVRTVEVNMQGPGSGRDAVVRALQSTGLAVTVLRDVTPLPHNGCRPPKKRRV
ncbi:TPA: 30S ribosomal protein S11 [Candidatus Dependentiae bacterium]|nr:MAG: 30S ribosomal protein S11 [candidate division TM6 bacterium GW2011_GWE2_31_21]KKP53104.1 MAG: 30S ribosomal protein S11 [candidate division TM6 bacterium GW2011_GWF2_33_332]HBS47922.1 30S ribosomal protein S11 [Candidatus Dependentiae bacterium]HBZ73474.1 30S ribosomal protein S11 [Candidatus Dependentiae bacterium]